MKCWTWFLSAAIVAVVAVAPILAADAPAAAPKAPEAKADAPATPAAAPAAAAPAKPSVEGDLAVMVRECKLTEEQTTKLADAANAIMVQLAEWQKANADKMAGFQKAYETARAANDEAAMAKVRTDAIPAMQERMAVIMKGQKGMMQILTPEQRATWLGFITFRQLMGGMAAVDLTTEQLTKIREICNASGKDMDAIKDEGEAGLAALMKVRTSLLTNVRENVLTVEQRAKMPPMPEPPAAATKAPAANTKAPAAETKAPAKDAKAPETKAPAK